ncbi:MAG: FAD-dependent oxidoreductase, partial [Erysipelotrichaceae bacterium]
MSQKVVIIGGVAGGATAATRLRRLNEDTEIILFEKGEYISFANCGLPYHVGNVIKERDDLLLQTVEGMKDQYNIDIRNFSEVTEIDGQKKEVTIHHHPTNKTYKESFDKLIISTGAKAFIPPINGIGSALNVFSLRNIPDMDQIKHYIKQHNVQTATVIGGGFIGLEMMENLKEIGIHVQLVEMAPQVMPNIDIEMAQQLHSQMNLHGVDLYLNDGLKEFQDEGKSLLLTSGKTLATDMTILSIGVIPENTLAKEAGVELGFKQAIKVSETFETNIKDIYAIGDVIEVPDFVDQSPTNIPLAWPANRQGRLVADIINGLPIDYTGTQGTSVAKVFELTVASTGNSERLLKNKGIDFTAIHIHPNSHAGYYPNASPIHLKLLFGSDGKILG